MLTWSYRLQILFYGDEDGLGSVSLSSRRSSLAERVVLGFWRWGGMDYLRRNRTIRAIYLGLDYHVMLTVVHNALRS